MINFARDPLTRLFFSPPFVHFLSIAPTYPIWHSHTCPLTCVPSFKDHLPSTSSVLSHLCFCPSCLCLRTWIAAVIPVSPSVIRGQRRNRCNTGSYPTREHFTVQALICHHWQPGKKKLKKSLMIWLTEKRQTPYTFDIYITTTLTGAYSHRNKRMAKNTWKTWQN